MINVYGGFLFYAFIRKEFLIWLLANQFKIFIKKAMHLHRLFNLSFL